MLLDTLTMFSDGQALSGSTVDSTKTLDLGSMSFTNEPTIIVRFEKDNHGCTSVELQSDQGEGFKVYGSHVVTDTKAGAGVNLPIPADVKGKVKLVYKGASMTGKVTAAIAVGADSPRGFRAGDFKRTFN